MVLVAVLASYYPTPLHRHPRYALRRSTIVSRPRDLELRSSPLRLTESYCSGLGDASGFDGRGLITFYGCLPLASPAPSALNCKAA